MKKIFQSLMRFFDRVYEPAKRLVEYLSDKL